MSHLFFVFLMTCMVSMHCYADDWDNPFRLKISPDRLKSNGDFRYIYDENGNIEKGAKNFYFLSKSAIMIYFKDNQFDSLRVYPTHLSGYSGGYFFDVSCDEILNLSENICAKNNVYEKLTNQNCPELAPVAEKQILKELEFLKSEGYSEENFYQAILKILKLNHFSEEFIEVIRKRMQVEMSSKMVN